MARPRPYPAGGRRSSSRSAPSWVRSIVVLSPSSQAIENVAEEPLRFPPPILEPVLAGGPAPELEMPPVGSRARPRFQPESRSLIKRAGSRARSKACCHRTSAHHCNPPLDEGLGRDADLKPAPRGSSRARRDPSPSSSVRSSPTSPIHAPGALRTDRSNLSARPRPGRASGCRAAPRRGARSRRAGHGRAAPESSAVAPEIAASSRGSPPRGRPVAMEPPARPEASRVHRLDAIAEVLGILPAQVDRGLVREARGGGGRCGCQFAGAPPPLRDRPAPASVDRVAG